MGRWTVAAGEDGRIAADKRGRHENGHGILAKNGSLHLGSSAAASAIWPSRPASGAHIAGSRGLFAETRKASAAAAA